MNERDPFDGPSPVGVLGEAMAGLTDAAPEAQFSARAIRSQHEQARSYRRQLSGGLAAGVAVIAAFGLIGVGIIASGGSDSASTAASAASSVAASTSVVTSSSSSSAATSSSSSAAMSASSIEAGSTGDLTPAAAPAPGSAADGGSVAGRRPAETQVPCRSLPFSDRQLGAVENTIGGLTRQDSCAVDGPDLAAQRYVVAGGTLLAEVRAGGYDPCPGLGGTACTDVAGRPGVRTAELPAGSDLKTQVWLASPERSVVLTADPAGVVPVEALAAAVEALAAAG